VPLFRGHVVERRFHSETAPEELAQRGIVRLERGRARRDEPLHDDLAHGAEPDLAGETGIARRDETGAQRVVEIASESSGEAFANREEARRELASVGIDEEEASEAAVAAEDLESALDGGVRASQRILFGRRCGLEATEEEVGGALEESAEERLLAGEVEVEAALGSVGLGGDLVHGCVAVPAPGEDVERGLEDALAPPGPLSGVRVGGYRAIVVARQWSGNHERLRGGSGEQ
jgi:hypothetical protein